ncbi:hypothetical protein B0T11DRAFT_320786 [Plectosphaerella cucumerina]|uniref:RNA recognition motif-containing protein n=1 Tax=Plectosphaerella cucumerina TaxID=40658 RepID=A0A8K0TAI4_9PEZI|nr:hypothetical protein B0T11DRAFT_320786 [Plectosphaerella cucumerina]
MAARPGEDNVATLFGDIHYFYGPPTQNPPHHRFDKGSYVYLFENATERRARIEIANQPGTEDQDAFDGFLDQTHVRYSYNQECVVSITVGQTNDPSVWHLPTFDPRNENKYHYPLHSLDIYFWTKKDAIQFVYGVQRLLPPTQVDIRDEPAPPAHRADPSAVVQQLEHLAVSDPSYHAPQAAPVQQQHHQPPLSAVSTEQAAPTSFVPIPYNPAAPAAPEQVRHREKTPPPDDGGIDPLAQAVAYDAQAPFSPGFVPPPGFQTGQPPLLSPGLPGPPSALGPHPGIQRSATMPVQSQGSAPGFPGFQPPPPPPPPQQQLQQQQQQQQPAQATTPPSSQASPAAAPAPPASAPPGGFSQYTYAQQQQPQPATTASVYSVHSSFYTPTEEEANKYKDYNKGKEPKKLEENFGRLEKGVSGMLKRFEKKFG